MPQQRKLTLKNAVLAMCHQCMGYYSDGVVDCECYSCPLYTWQPRAFKEMAETDWLNINPKRKGKVTFDECKREMSDEEREKLVARGKALAASRVKQTNEDDFNFDIDNELDDDDDMGDLE